MSHSSKSEGNRKSAARRLASDRWLFRWQRLRVGSRQVHPLSSQSQQRFLEKRLTWCRQPLISEYCCTLAFSVRVQTRGVGTSSLHNKRCLCIPTNSTLAVYNATGSWVFDGLSASSVGVLQL